MAFISDDISINTLIGSGSFVSGDIRINGFLRIDGDIKGNIETTGNIIIGEKARIMGNITAASAIIGGIVIGDINAPKQIKLLSTSAVIGDVITKNLQVEETVVVHGHCISLSNDDNFNTASEKLLNERAIRSKVI